MNASSGSSEVVDRPIVSFRKNLAVAFSGNAVAYLVGILFTPFLTRVFGPSTYGLFALFNSLVAAFAVAATLSYSNAFILPRSRETFLPLVQAAIVACAAVTGVVAAAALTVGDDLLRAADALQIQPYIVLIPIALVLTGMSDSLRAWNTRLRRFDLAARASVAGVVASKIVALAFGLFVSVGPVGLIAGELAHRVVNTLMQLSASIRSDLVEVFRRWEWRSISSAAREYKGYPIYTLPGTWLAVLSGALPLYVLAFGYDAETVGQYSLAASMLNLPVQLLANATAPVFLQEAAERFDGDREGFRSLCRTTLTKALPASLLAFVCLGVVSDLAFQLVFGAQWRTAGTLAAALSIPTAMTIATIPLTTVFRVLRRESYQLWLSAFHLLVPGAALMVASGEMSMLESVVVFSGALAFSYLVQIATVVRLTGLPLGLFARTVLYVGAAASVLIAARAIIQL